MVTKKSFSAYIFLVDQIKDPELKKLYTTKVIEVLSGVHLCELSQLMNFLWSIQDYLIEMKEAEKAQTYPKIHHKNLYAFSEVGFFFEELLSKVEKKELELYEWYRNIIFKENYSIGSIVINGISNEIFTKYAQELVDSNSEEKEILFPYHFHYQKELIKYWFSAVNLSHPEKVSFANKTLIKLSKTLILGLSDSLVKFFKKIDSSNSLKEVDILFETSINLGNLQGVDKKLFEHFYEIFLKKGKKALFLDFMGNCFCSEEVSSWVRYIEKQPYSENEQNIIGNESNMNDN